MDWGGLGYFILGIFVGMPYGILIAATFKRRT